MLTKKPPGEERLDERAADDHFPRLEEAMRIFALVVAGVVLGGEPALADGLFTFQREPSGPAMSAADFWCGVARYSQEHQTEAREATQKECDAAKKTAEDEAQKKNFDNLRKYMPVILPYRPPSIQDQLGEINDRLKAIEQQGR